MCNLLLTSFGWWGLTQIAAGTNIFAYMLVGLPLAFTFALVIHMDVLGLWLGLAVALLVQVKRRQADINRRQQQQKLTPIHCTQAIILSLVLCRVDWEAQSAAAVKRAQAESAHMGATAASGGGSAAGGSIEGSDRIRDSDVEVTVALPVRAGKHGEYQGIELAEVEHDPSAFSLAASDDDSIPTSDDDELVLA